MGIPVDAPSRAEAGQDPQLPRPHRDRRHAGGRAPHPVHDGHYDPDLIDLAREANRPGWWTKYNIDDRGYISMETEAATVLEFGIMNIPGLLQTERYMRALFATGTVRRSRERLKNDVAARLHRQRRLTDEDFPLQLVAIIDEAALRRRVGGVEVMRDQLGHLVMLSELSTVSVQVLPNEVGAHSGMDGAFIILTFPEDEDPSVLCGRAVWRMRCLP